MLARMRASAVAPISRYPLADSSFIKTPRTDVFVQLSSDYPRDSLKIIAKLGNFVHNTHESNLSNLFSSFKKKSNELGANVYYIHKIQKEISPWYIEIYAYFLESDELIENYKFYPRNMVYVIGDIAMIYQPKKIRFNGKKMYLNPLVFIEYQNQTGKDAILSHGGYFGAKTWVHGREDRLPRFLSIGSIPILPDRVEPVPYKYSKGLITPVDLGLGQFLISVLNQKE